MNLLPESKKPIVRSKSFSLLLACSLFLLTMYGCAVGPKKALHSFSFDARFHMNDIEVVDFRYGSGPKFPIRTRCMPIPEDGGKCLQRVSANLLEELAETLWVKWKIVSTGEIVEDTIVLAKWLPLKMDGATLFFIIRGRQLTLYVDTEEPRPKGFPNYEGVRNQYTKVYKIYPESDLGKF
jgi:hypothetical protein